MKTSKPIKVNVTRSDITNGKRQCCTRCPVALAVRRAVKSTSGLRRYWSVEVLNTHLNLRTWDFFPVRVNLPLVARKFIAVFDSTYSSRSNIKPFSFTLNIQ